MSNSPTRFGIEIDFKLGVGDPSRVFRTMSDLINALQDLDRALIGTIDTKLEPILLLEDVETGSIRAWLRQSIEALNDDTLKKAVVGNYLLKSKHIIIDFLKERTEITDASQVAELETRILAAAEETDVKKIPVYVPPSRQKLLQGMDAISGALSPLIPEDKATYLSSQGNTNFNKSFHIAPDEIQDLITSEIIENPYAMIMKVKKPDFLGESKWEFKHDNRVIDAKMADEQWVADYHAGKMDIRPGDAIRAIVLVSVRYGLDREVLSTQYTIQKVHEIIPRDKTEQAALFGSKEGNG
jgi:hypothetical protein